MPDAAASPPAYPPADHLLRDLGIALDPARGGRLEAALPAAALLADGCVPAGVLATLADVAGGAAALAAARPGWVATASLDLRLRRALRGAPGPVLAEPEVMARSRSRITLEVRLREAGADVPCALATMDFAVLEPRGAVQRHDEEAAPTRVVFARADEGPPEALRRRLGLRVVDAPGGVCELPHGPFVTNSLGGLQGGAVALLADAAAEAAAGPGARSEALAIHYLALGRRGPHRSEARVLRRDAAGAWVRISVRDTGADDRLIALVDARIAWTPDARRP